jgi:twitching motility protein PilT
VQLAAALTGVVYQRLLPAIGGGMVAAYEVLVADAAIRNLIREGKTNQLRNSLVTGQRSGMVTLEQSLAVLVREGRVTADDARAYSLHPKEIDVPASQPTRLSA